MQISNLEWKQNLQITFVRHSHSQKIEKPDNSRESQIIQECFGASKPKAVLLKLMNSNDKLAKNKSFNSFPIVLVRVNINKLNHLYTAMTSHHMNKKTDNLPSII